MTGRALLLASALVAALAALLTRTADAANWLEMDFYLSGPQYEGKLPPCDYRDALVNDRLALQSARKHVLGDRSAHPVLREDPRDRVPALGCQRDSTPLLQRGGRGHRRPQTCHPLFDLRGHRDDRRQLGHRVVRGRARSQLVVQSGLQNGEAVI